MTKEPRIIVRLIALWIIFIASVTVVFCGGQHFAVSLVKIASGNYGNTECPAGMGYCPPPPTFTSCIMPPTYPYMGDPAAQPVDSGTMSKYNQDYQEYNKAYQKACEQDITRQQGSQKNSSITEMAGYAVLLLAGIVAAMVSLMAIKKAEMEAVV